MAKLHTFTGAVNKPNDATEEAGKACGVALLGLTFFVIGLVLGIGGMIWEGYVLTWLWVWFILPYFQLPYLSVPLAIAVVLTARLITNQLPAKDTSSALGFLFVRPAVMLLFGWVLHTYFMG